MFHPCACAQIDGFSSETFHRKCDGHARLLVAARSESGFWFGGFSSVPFNSTTNKNAYVEDPTAFLFSMTNPHGTPPVMCPVDPKQVKTAIYNGEASMAGACYGTGAALFLCNNADRVAGSYSKLEGGGYTDPSGLGNALFTGASKFGPLSEILAWEM